MTSITRWFSTTKGSSSRGLFQSVVQSLTAPTLFRRSITHFRILPGKLHLSQPSWIIFISNIRCEACILIVAFFESTLLQVLPFRSMFLYILAADVGRCNSSMACGTASPRGVDCISYRSGLWLAARCRWVGIIEVLCGCFTTLWVWSRLQGVRSRCVCIGERGVGAGDTEGLAAPLLAEVTSPRRFCS
jgi:hypothetical protein